MKNFDLITPEGTKDLLFDECILRRETEDKIHHIFKSRGYHELITPGLEFFDVFNLKSRYFPQEGLYKLIDNKGRLLVLRPDSTMPIARVVATRLKDAALPLRLYYNQCIYTINPSLTGRSDQIAQMGIELIGSDSKMADLEVITSAVEVLYACSDGDFSLEIGDAGLFDGIIKSLDNDEIAEKIRTLIETKNYPALDSLVNANISDAKLNYALKQLPRLFGGAEVFDKANELFYDDKSKEILHSLKSLYKDIKKLYPEARITVDFGLVNRTNYYTGVIIKGYLAGHGEEVLSGGRYDKLISEFGYDVPATGFAVNINAILKILSRESVKKTQPSDVIVFAEKGYELEAVKKAEVLRKSGRIAELALCEDIQSAREYAKDRGIPEIIVVDAEVE